MAKRKCDHEINMSSDDVYESIKRPPSIVTDSKQLSLEMTQPPTQPMSQPMTQPMSQPMTQPPTQPMSRSMIQQPSSRISLFDLRPPSEISREIEASEARDSLTQLFEAQDRIYRLCRLIAIENILSNRDRRNETSHNNQICSICMNLCTTDTKRCLLCKTTPCLPDCKRNFSQVRNAMMLPCKHHFHIKCLAPWVLVKDTCPNCRASVNGNSTKHY
jgi:hypothetical protein